MTTTTDPRTVTTGPVRISATSTEKRAALIGRWATFETYQDGIRVGRIESLEGTAALLRFPDGCWSLSGRTVTLVPEPDETGLSEAVLTSFAEVVRDSSDDDLRTWAVQTSRGVDDTTPLPTYQARVALLHRIHAEQQRRRTGQPATSR